MQAPAAVEFGVRVLGLDGVGCVEPEGGTGAFSEHATNCLLSAKDCIQ